MIPYDRVRERYLHDAAFKQAVDVMQSMVMGLHLTPSEVREAAMLACIMIEERRTDRPVYVRQECLDPDRVAAIMRADLLQWLEKPR